MFQRLSNLLFGQVEEVAAELKGPNPCVTEADEEGWMLVNLSDKSSCVMQTDNETQAQLLTEHPFPDHNQSNLEENHTRTQCQTSIPRPPNKRQRTRSGCTQEAILLLDPAASPNPSNTCVTTLLRRARLSATSSTNSTSPAASECGGSGDSSRAVSERGCMDESWFVTPPPCFTAEGATAEASPMEDLLIEHPSMSVYVSPSNLSMVSNSNLSVVGEESVVSMTSSVRVAEPVAAPATHTPGPFRGSFGPHVQPKVAQVTRVQRNKARIERRQLSRNRIQRQNRIREQIPRHASHARNTFLHQPSKRNFCH
ncbi:tumor protein p53-inducible nuclear protein 1 isoform X1 [Syngnathoides biaculeatus]|uniref:tumor protein p53-inducible nuclear protein 1 isoform X1 n=1 Tax=Syngnathoides biaculeatus TaxID=300417 RepID=UPI002ADE3F27|nr:tumor protein p53-inducible nuclear protein 1 isoform X1 [Syngnathoides biaculeatus]XP_061667922.1 tumor protein p53-inducible nuclear protein 1 isoform X1 [Syngnathoides biaculeatus]XP_061667931.1 tumor protein p53-inducible nuclear protein 1 isoform X1 [Syngnathoides biaculeatus]